MAITKTTRTSLLTIVSVASNTIQIGAAVNVASYHAASGRIRMGRASATAFTTAPEIHLQATAESGTPSTDSWETVAGPFVPQVGATIGNQAVSGTAAAAATTVTLAAGTNFASSDYIFFHNTTLANSEWKRFVSVAAAVLTFGTGDGLAFAQTGSTARDQSEDYPFGLDLTPWQQLRVVVFAYGTGQAVIVQADMGLMAIS